jgi:hypothetical protein
MKYQPYTPVAKHLHDFAATPVDSLGWTTIVPVVGASCVAIEIFAATGAIMKLSIGAIGDEDAHEIPYFTIPGGSSILLPVRISKGARISAKSMDSVADAGSLVLNLFG